MFYNNRQAMIKTTEGTILFRLSSHIVSHRNEEGRRTALHVQISIPNRLVPQTAAVFLAANGEFRICPYDRKAFRFKKDRHGLYNYLDKAKMLPLEPKSVRLIGLLVINYEEILQTFQILK